ncbi:unnamed protein product [marine sediment metagenome]|uniref:Uncharacterized protein n=1 Tax=marine sediment metagenome TaxID=412755 RepID=X1BH55_9ZZZZ
MRAEETQCPRGTLDLLVRFADVLRRITGFQTTKIAHNDVCDDWNLDLDPDDLSWASESKQNCGNPS